MSLDKYNPDKMIDGTSHQIDRIFSTNPSTFERNPDYKITKKPVETPILNPVNKGDLGRFENLNAGLPKNGAGSKKTEL